MQHLRKIFHTILLVLLLLHTGCAGQIVSPRANFSEGSKAYKSRDYVTAVKLWEPLAEQGHVNAQYNLGFMYAKGEGVTQSYENAMKMWRLAAEKGYVSAQYNIGVLYHRGRGVNQDFFRAHMWYVVAATSGHKHAMDNRDIVAKNLTPTQVKKSTRLADECAVKNYKGC